MPTAALVLIHHCSEFKQLKKKKTPAVTQMNWTRRAPRMKNKKLFCFLVTYPTAVTQKKQWITCGGFMHMDLA